jgi:hypothetical protein
MATEQEAIDEARARMADDVIASVHFTTADAWKRYARAWIITAAQNASNAEYYKAERDKLARKLKRGLR